MPDHMFRFGVVAGFAPSAEAWTGIARRAEELGYATLLVPDTLGTLAPFAALAAAGGATSTLRLGTFVLSVANREPGVVAWETASVDLLTGGRFELGLGAGRPDAEADAAALGRTFGTPGERIQLLADTIAAVKAGRESHLRTVQQPHPPILVAAGGPRATRLAVSEADIIAIGAPPQAGEDELRTRIDGIKQYAGDRLDRIELSVNLLAVGDEPPAWVPARFVPKDLDGSAAVLTGSVDEMADTLRRRRDELGISYVSVNAAYADRLAPVVERLAGT
jgi:probable F420-dependent oxidoreductase